MLVRQPFERHHFVRRCNDMEAATVLGGCCSDQLAVEPCSSLKQVGQRQFRLKSELEASIAKLNIEVDQARFAPMGCFARREANCQLAEQCRRTDPAKALDNGYELRIAAALL